MNKKYSTDKEIAINHTSETNDNFDLDEEVRTGSGMNRYNLDEQRESLDKLNSTQEGAGGGMLNTLAKGHNNNASDILPKVNISDR